MSVKNAQALFTVIALIAGTTSVPVFFCDHAHLGHGKFRLFQTISTVCNASSSLRKKISDVTEQPGQVADVS